MHVMETFKSHWAGPNGCRFLLEDLFPLLTFIIYCYILIHWSLSPAASSVSLLMLIPFCSFWTYT